MLASSTSFGQTTPDSKPTDPKPTAESIPTSPAETAPAPSTGPSEGGPRAGDTIRTVGLVVGGVGVAGLAVFMITGLMAKSTFNDLRDECPRPCTDAAHLDQIDHGKSLQTTANVALAAGSVGLGTGVVLYLLGLDQSRDAAVSVSPSSGGALATYRLRF